ncbi:MAG TPA: hypothetical protein VIE89_26595 [Candidatus Binatia bacterium]|jgi:hypothetical protein
MFHYLFKKVQQWLLPEWQSNGTRYLQPPDAVRLIYVKILQLARQIEFHAELAPYPQVAAALRRMAGQKQAIAQRLKRIIEVLPGPVPEESLHPPATAKNHWQRLIRDLEDQRRLDDLLFQYELPISQRVPQVSDIFRELKTLDEAHRRLLGQLVAVADPQATQT